MMHSRFDTANGHFESKVYAAVAGTIPMCTDATASSEDQRAIEYRARRLALLCLRALERHRSQLAPALACRPQSMAGAEPGDTAGPLAQALLLLTGGLSLRLISCCQQPLTDSDKVLPNSGMLQAQTIRN